LPSAELQTSRGGAEKESNHPPRSQSRSLKTTSPLESRGRQPARSVTRTQSGVRVSPRAEAGHTRTAVRTATDHLMARPATTAQLGRPAPDLGGVLPGGPLPLYWRACGRRVNGPSTQRRDEKQPMVAKRGVPGSFRSL